MKKVIAALLVIPFLYLSRYESSTLPEFIEVKPVGAAVLTYETVTEPEVIVEPVTEPIYMGEFTLTAYCSCSKCCGKWASNRPVDEDGNEIVIGSTGEVLRSDYSIAVDPEVIPYGSIVIINGKEYEAQDTGGAITGSRIDVYFSSHEEALEFGRQTADIYLKEVF